MLNHGEVNQHSPSRSLLRLRRLADGELSRASCAQSAWSWLVRLLRLGLVTRGGRRGGWDIVRPHLVAGAVLRVVAALLATLRSAGPTGFGLAFALGELELLELVEVRSALAERDRPFVAGVQDHRVPLDRRHRDVVCLATRPLLPLSRFGLESLLEGVLHDLLETLLVGVLFDHLDACGLPLQVFLDLGDGRLDRVPVPEPGLLAERLLHLRLRRVDAEPEVSEGLVPSPLVVDRVEVGRNRATHLVQEGKAGFVCHETLGDRNRQVVADDGLRLLHGREPVTLDEFVDAYQLFLASLLGPDLRPEGVELLLGVGLGDESASREDHLAAHVVGDRFHLLRPRAGAHPEDDAVEDRLVRWGQLVRLESLGVQREAHRAVVEFDLDDLVCDSGLGGETLDHRSAERAVFQHRAAPDEVVPLAVRTGHRDRVGREHPVDDLVGHLL